MTDAATTLAKEITALINRGNLETSGQEHVDGLLEARGLSHPQPTAQGEARLSAPSPETGQPGRATPPSALSVIASETEQSINEWAEATFGPTGSNASVAARALKELAELIQKLTADDTHAGAAEELADVEIVFARLWVRLGANRQAEIDRKMATNRARKWRLTGDGHGQHV